MGTLVRIRITLADRPGSLGAVATLIGEHGGNIVAVDVHRSGVVSAVDDLVVDFPEDHDLDNVRNDLTAGGIATLLATDAGYAADPIVAAFACASRVLATRGANPEADLAEVVAELCSAPVVWVSTTEEAAGLEAGRFALERAGPIALRTAQLPAEMADRLAGEVWLLAVPDRELVAPGRVVFVARPLADEFTTTEIERIEAIMALHNQVERLLADP